MGTGSSVRIGATGARASTKPAGGGGTKSIRAGAAWGSAAPSRDLAVAEPECSSQPQGQGAVRSGADRGASWEAWAWTGCPWSCAERFTAEPLRCAAWSVACGACIGRFSPTGSADPCGVRSAGTGVEGGHGAAALVTWATSTPSASPLDSASSTAPWYRSHSAGLSRSASQRGAARRDRSRVETPGDPDEGVPERM